jgi:hypothetical protein
MPDPIPETVRATPRWVPTVLMAMGPCGCQAYTEEDE